MVRLRQKRYEQSAKGKATLARYQHSPKGVATRLRYENSDKGKDARASYKASPKGVATMRQCHLRHYYKHRDHYSYLHFLYRNKHRPDVNPSEPFRYVNQVATC